MWSGSDSSQPTTRADPAPCHTLRRGCDRISNCFESVFSRRRRGGGDLTASLISDGMPQMPESSWTADDDPQYVTGQASSASRLSEAFRPRRSASRASNASQVGGHRGSSASSASRPSWGADLRPPPRPSKVERVPRYSQGTHVKVWSNGQKKWFEDGVIVEAVSQAAKFDGPPGHEGARKVLAGSVKVRFDRGKSLKWLSPRQIHEGLQKIPYKWEMVSKDERIPDRAVWSGQPKDDHDIFVGRSKSREGGMVLLQGKPGKKVLSQLWCVSGDKLESGEVLVPHVGFHAAWTTIKVGDESPNGAVFIGTGSDGDTFVCRNKNGDAGKYTVSGSPGHWAISAFQWPRGGKVDEAEALVLKVADRELEVNLTAVEGCQQAEVKLGNLVGKGAVLPYVEVEFMDLKQRSGYRQARNGSAEIGEKLFFPLPWVSGEQGEERTINFRVMAKAQGLALKGDQEIGHGSMKLKDVANAPAQTVTINRSKGEPARIACFVQQSSSGVDSSSVGQEALAAGATMVTTDTLMESLKKFCENEDQQLQETMQIVCDVMCNGGGAISVIVLDSAAKDKDGPPFEYYDNGASVHLSRIIVGNISKDKDKFDILLTASSTTSQCRQWDSKTLEELAFTLKTPLKDLPRAAELMDRPKGGSWIISARGTILATNCGMELGGCEWPTFQQAGIRFNDTAALGAAYWLGQNSPKGAVFVRSETGAVTVLMPASSGDAPTTYHVPSYVSPYPGTLMGTTFQGTQKTSPSQRSIGEVSLTSASRSRSPRN